MALWMKLESRERRVVHGFVERLETGQRLYGPLTRGKKNWAKEAYEESLDKGVYELCALLDLAEEADSKAVVGPPKHLSMWSQGDAWVPADSCSCSINDQPSLMCPVHGWSK